MRLVGITVGWRAFRACLLLACMGCEEGEASSTQLFCQASCDRFVACGLSDRGCESRCMSQVTGPENMRVDAMTRYADCLSGGSCAEFEAETVFERCWDSSFVGLPATDYGRSFCGAYATRWFECGYRYPVEECEQDFGKYTDDTLEQLNGCVRTSSCVELGACAEQVLDG